MKSLTRSELASRLDLALGDVLATRNVVEDLCSRARRYGFRGVCLPGSRIELARALLEEADTKVTALVGYPCGGADADVKRYETEVAVDHGAHEIEFVPTLGRLKDGDRAFVLRELRDIVEAADERPVRAVMELSLLTQDESRTLCELALDSGISGLVTGTSRSGAATVDQVRGLRSLLGASFQIKAGGGIEKTLAAVALLESGANILGVQNGEEILDGIGHPPIL